MDSFEQRLIGFIIGILFLIVGLTYVSAGVESDLWNECHPEFPVTQYEMWMASTIFRIEECGDG